MIVAHGRTVTNMSARSRVRILDAIFSTDTKSLVHISVDDGGNAVGFRSRRTSRVSATGGGDRAAQFGLTPVAAIRKAYAVAVGLLDPMTVSSKPRTFADMTDAERTEMRKLYEKKPKAF